MKLSWVEYVLLQPIGPVEQLARLKYLLSDLVVLLLRVSSLSRIVIPFFDEITRLLGDQVVLLLRFSSFEF